MKKNKVFLTTKECELFHKLIYTKQMSNNIDRVYKSCNISKDEADDLIHRLEVRLSKRKLL